MGRGASESTPHLRRPTRHPPIIRILVGGGSGKLCGDLHSDGRPRGIEASDETGCATGDG